MHSILLSGKLRPGKAKKTARKKLCAKCRSHLLFILGECKPEITRGSLWLYNEGNDKESYYCSCFYFEEK